MTNEEICAALLLATRAIAKARRTLADPGAGREKRNTALDMLRYIEGDLEHLSNEVSKGAGS